MTLYIVVTQLQGEVRGDGPSEEVLACGRWKKPSTLSDAKFDFLVMDAFISSTKESAKFHRIGERKVPAEDNL